MAGDGIVHGGTAAAIGHVDEPNPRLLRQQHHREVADAAAADRGIAHAIGLRLGGRDDVGERLERFLRMGRDHIGRGADEQHRVEVLLGVVGQASAGRTDWRRGCRTRSARCCRRAATWRPPRCRRCRRARPVLDDDGGAQPLLQVGLHEPRHHVGRACRRVGNHDLDGCPSASLPGVPLTRGCERRRHRTEQYRAS